MNPPVSQSLTADARVALLGLVDEYESEQAELADLLSSLAEADWSRPTPAAGWDVRDQVAHLAHTEELAHDTAAGGSRQFNDEVARYPTGAAFTESGCEQGRAMSPAEVRAWWEAAAGRTRAALRALDPAARVPWGIGMGARAFVTARLMEHWAHGLDIRAAVGAAALDTARLRHVAWIGVNALPYAMSLAAAEGPPGRTLRFELVPPPEAGASPWEYGPADATDRVMGPAGEWCRLAVQRMSRADATGLVADGPLAELALAHARAFL